LYLAKAHGRALDEIVAGAATVAGAALVVGLVVGLAASRGRGLLGCGFLLGLRESVGRIDGDLLVLLGETDRAQGHEFVELFLALRLEDGLGLDHLHLRRRRTNALLLVTRLAGFDGTAD